jgi:hypothetical protein
MADLAATIPEILSADLAEEIPAAAAPRVAGRLERNRSKQRMQRILDKLVGRLVKDFGDELVSIVLYGSAAVGDHQGRFSDLNILCVLRGIGVRQLAQAEEVFHWWRKQGNPSPLLLSLDELHSSTDCFPIEFQDIRERHRILHGDDVVAGLEVGTVFYRAQVEHELRSKLLRLRQKAGGVLSDEGLLLRLMAESVSTFCILLRHTLLLSGHPCGFAKREIITNAEAAFGIDPQPFTTLIDLRDEQGKPRGLQPRLLLESYLEQIGKAVAAVDRLER